MVFESLTITLNLIYLWWMSDCVPLGWLRTSSRSTRCRPVSTVSTFLASLCLLFSCLWWLSKYSYFRQTCSCKLLSSLPIEFPTAHVSFTRAFWVFEQYPTFARRRKKDRVPHICINIYMNSMRDGIRSHFPWWWTKCQSRLAPSPAGLLPSVGASRRPKGSTNPRSCHNVTLHHTYLSFFNTWPHLTTLYHEIT